MTMQVFKVFSLWDSILISDLLINSITTCDKKKKIQCTHYSPIRYKLRFLLSYFYRSLLSNTSCIQDTVNQIPDFYSIKIHQTLQLNIKVNIPENMNISDSFFSSLNCSINSTDSGGILQ